MSQTPISPLVSCSIDVLANITSRLSGNELLTLYMTDKTRLRLRLTHHGGVESLNIEYLQYLGARDILSFPVFPCRFTRLLSLKIHMPSLFGKPYVVGTLVYLPSSLTSLHIQQESAMNAWLQPANWTGNNDDNDWGKAYKPIYLDRLFPKLRTLVLLGGSQNIFSPNSRLVTPALSNPYFSPAVASIFPIERQREIDDSFELKLSMEWTPKMKEAWFRHLPPSLLDLELSTSLPENEHEPDNSNPFELLPPHLTRLVIPQHYSKKKALDRLSMMPQSLRDSLVELSIACPQDSPIFDAPLPPHLTAFRIPNSWASLAHGLSEALPPDLKILTMGSMCTLDSISYLPPHLTHLELGVCPIYQLLPIVPQRLVHLVLNVRYASDWTSLLPRLPPTLTTLVLNGEVAYTEEAIAAIPREVLHLTLEGSPQLPLKSASLLRLPPHLLSLRLGQCSSTVGEEGLRALPQTLTSLEMQSATIFNESIPLLPPKLTKLELPSVAGWTDDQLHKLPQGLTRLRLSAVKVTGRLLKEGIRQITVQELQDSVTGILPPQIVEEKKRQNQVRYADPVFFSYDSLLHIPQSVTKIDFTGASGLLSGMGETLPNLVHLSLPVMNSPLTLIGQRAPSLTYLSAPKVHNMGLITAATGASLFPPNLTYLDISSYSAPNSPDLVFPKGLTYFSIGNIEVEYRKALQNLTQLETFRMEHGSGLGISDLPPLLPRSIKHLYLGTYAQSTDKFLEHLPPNLETLETPNLSVLSDSGFHLLPETLKSFNVGTFAYRNVEDYRDGPEMEEFDSPKNLIDILVYKRSNIRFKLSNSSKPISSEKEGAASLSEVPKLTMIAKNYDVVLGDELGSVISRSVTRLTLSELHRGLTVKFLKYLPPTLLHLDLGKQEHGFDEKSALALPRGLLSLVMNASEFTDPEFLSYLPRTLLSLELIKLPGRLSQAKAQMLPPSLTRLRLGLCIVGDDVISLLPRSITILDLPNTPFVTNKGLPDLPPNLVKLWIPTARLTPECVDMLPSSLESLSLGSGSGFPSVFALAKLKRRVAEQSQAIAPHEPIVLTTVQ